MSRFGRHFLQIPGPTNVPDRVLRAMDYPTIDHRGPKFAEIGEIGKKALAGMKRVVKTQAGQVVIYPASGTGAWEAALVNTLSPGDKVVMFETGHFAWLWDRLATRIGLAPEVIGEDWRRAADPEAIEAALRADTDKEIKAVCVVQNETSTGCATQVPEIRAAIDAAGHPALLMVDTISSLASIDMRMDEWGVDVIVAGSQKGLMLPPGLSFNAISPKALAAHEEAGLSRSYWDWSEMLAPNAKGFFPYTPATNLLYGLVEAIDILEEEGPRQRLRSPRPPCRGDPPRRTVLRAGDPVRRAAAPFLVADRDPDARGSLGRRLPQGGAGQLRHVARLRPQQGRRQAVPHRPPRRLQRPDADGHALGLRDGAGAG